VASRAETPSISLEKQVVVVRRRSPAWVAAKWLGIALGVLVALIAAFLIWLNSDSGRRFVVGQINGLELTSGLRVEVDGIEGSLWGEMTLRGLVLSDLRGPFLAAPEAQIDYRPLAYLRTSLIDIRSLVIPEARFARLPELRPGDPDAPLIPNISLNIAELRIGRLIVDRR
jgi:translocation and assembly module TamB